VDVTDIGKMTIEELEEAARRVSAALEVLREAGALGLARPAQPESSVPALTSPGRTLHWSGPGGSTAVIPQAQAQTAPQPPATPVTWEPGELAMREKLLKGIRADPNEEEAAQ
jgi:hypothetical protein